MRSAFWIALWAALLLAPGCSEPEPPGPRNLILVTVDTLRADHLSSYGYEFETSPILDAWARGGVRFMDATVPWPKTWPAMAALMTGQYPRTNGIRYRPRIQLPQQHLTLAEALQGAGYATGAVVANANLSRKFAFDQGFDEFVESWMAEFVKRNEGKKFKNASGLTKQYTNATVVTDQGLEVLDRIRTKKDRFFLWLHYIDPHGPYVPPPGYEHLFPEEPTGPLLPPGKLLPYQQQEREGQVVRRLDFYRAQYDREIRYFDDQFGRLLDELRKRDLIRNSMIVLTADHGESLGEHGLYLEHGYGPYQPTAGVPLIMVSPGRLPRERLVPDPVSLLDLMPTILAHLDVRTPSELQGTDLAAAIESPGTGEGPPFVVMESGYAPQTQLSLRQGKWKLVQLRHEDDRLFFRLPEYTLHDVTADPSETRDLRHEHGEKAREMVGILKKWERATPKYRPVGKKAPKLDAATRKQLRALGYAE